MTSEEAKEIVSSYCHRATEVIQGTANLREAWNIVSSELEVNEILKQYLCVVPYYEPGDRFQTGEPCYRVIRVKKETSSSCKNFDFCGVEVFRDNVGCNMTIDFNKVAAWLQGDGDDANIHSNS